MVIEELPNAFCRALELCGPSGAGPGSPEGASLAQPPARRSRSATHAIRKGRRSKNLSYASMVGLTAYLSCPIDRPASSDWA